MIVLFENLGHLGREFSAMCFIANGFVALMGGAKATDLVIGLAGDFFCRRACALGLFVHLVAADLREELYIRFDQLCGIGSFNATDGGKKEERTRFELSCVDLSNNTYLFLLVNHVFAR